MLLALAERPDCSLAAPESAILSSVAMCEISTAKERLEFTQNLRSHEATEGLRRADKLQADAEWIEATLLDESPDSEAAANGRAKVARLKDQAKWLKSLYLPVSRSVAGKAGGQKRKSAKNKPSRRVDRLNVEFIRALIGNAHLTEIAIAIPSLGLKPTTIGTAIKRKHCLHETTEKLAKALHKHARLTPPQAHEQTLKKMILR